MVVLGRAARANLLELSGVFGVVFFVLLLLSLGSRFSAYLQDAMTGDIAADALWLMLILRIPEFVQIVSPFSLFLAMLFVLGRLDADSEMPILQAAGVGPGQVTSWFAWFVVPLTVFITLLSLLVTPMARAKFVEIVTSQEMISELDVLKARTFRTYNDGRGVTYMHEIDREAGEVSGVFTNSLSEEGHSMTVVASGGRYHQDPQTGNRYLQLYDGKQFTQQSDGSLDRVAFDSLTQKLDSLSADDMGSESGAILTQNLNLQNPAELMEWHWRVGLPIMNVVLALIAIGLGRLKPRSGRYDRFLPGILLLATYYGVALFLVSQLGSNVQLAAIGLWPVHVLMLLAAWYFFRKQWHPS